MGSVFNVGSTEEITILELAKAIIEKTGSSSEIQLAPYDEAYPEGFEDMRRRVPDVSKIEALTAWRPRRTLQDILADTIADEQREQTAVPQRGCRLIGRPSPRLDWESALKEDQGTGVMPNPRRSRQGLGLTSVQWVVVPPDEDDDGIRVAQRKVERIAGSLVPRRSATRRRITKATTTSVHDRSAPPRRPLGYRRRACCPVT